MLNGDGACGRPGGRVRDQDSIFINGVMNWTGIVRGEERLIRQPVVINEWESVIASERVLAGWLDVDVSERTT